MGSLFYTIFSLLLLSNKKIRDSKLTRHTKKIKSAAMVGLVSMGTKPVKTDILKSVICLQRPISYLSFDFCIGKTKFLDSLPKGKVKNHTLGATSRNISFYKCNNTVWWYESIYFLSSTTVYFTFIYPRAIHKAGRKQTALLTKG